MIEASRSTGLKKWAKKVASAPIVAGGGGPGGGGSPAGGVIGRVSRVVGGARFDKENLVRVRVQKADVALNTPGMLNADGSPSTDFDFVRSKLVGQSVQEVTIVVQITNVTNGLLKKLTGKIILFLIQKTIFNMFYCYLQGLILVLLEGLRYRTHSLWYLQVNSFVFTWSHTLEKIGRSEFILD
jgi:hypothetical protein